MEKKLLTKLGEPNINGITYDTESYMSAIKRYIKKDGAVYKDLNRNGYKLSDNKKIGKIVSVNNDENGNIFCEMRINRDLTQEFIGTTVFGDIGFNKKANIKDIHYFHSCDELANDELVYYKDLRKDN